MENINLYCKIYELKGLIKALVDLSGEEERYDNPMIERMDTKMDEIIGEIENSGKRSA